MDRLKSALSYYPIIVIIAAIMGIGWSANALQSSKVDIKEFAPVKQDVTEMKVGRGYEKASVQLLDTKLNYLLVQQALEMQQLYMANQAAKK